MPVRRIAALAEGQAAEGARVPVEGVVSAARAAPAASAFAAPVSGRACVCFEVRVGDASFADPMWREHLVWCASVPFTLSDASGSLHVLADHAVIALELTRFVDLPSGHPLLARANLAARIGRQAREGAVAVGDRIWVAGVLVSEPDPDGAARVDALPGADIFRGAAAPTRLALTGTSRHPLLLTNIRDLAAGWAP